MDADLDRLPRRSKFRRLEAVTAFVRAHPEVVAPLSEAADKVPCYFGPGTPLIAEVERDRGVDGRSHRFALIQTDERWTRPRLESLPSVASTPTFGLAYVRAMRLSPRATLFAAPTSWFSPATPMPSRAQPAGPASRPSVKEATSPITGGRSHRHRPRSRSDSGLGHPRGAESPVPLDRRSQSRPTSSTTPCRRRSGADWRPSGRHPQRRETGRADPVGAGPVDLTV